ncbi:glycosyltransferase family 2 protein [Sphingopyxis sp.]|uniref:glycosyltransferase family 2 protein n=1 Tax=Sphingopyxis sp. TaxID=1908224 RepID=UPI003BAD75B4
MQFTVLIVTYNRADLIERSLDSIARQTFLPAEIVVVDDASTDNTGEVVQAWATRNSVPVRYIAAEKNGGEGVVRNIGMKAVTTPLIAFLDSDDEFRPDAMERLIAPLIADSSLAVSFGDAFVLPEPGPGLPPRLVESRLRADETSPMEGAPAGTGWRQLNDPQSTLLLISMIPTCSAMFRRDAAEAVGWFPEYRRAGDWLFWLKLTDQGGFAVQFFDAANVYRQGDNLTSAGTDALWAQQMLHVYLGLRDGSIPLRLTSANRARLETAIAEKSGHYRYWYSRKGWRGYWQALGETEARASGSRLTHLLRDPKSAARALYSSFRS